MTQTEPKNNYCILKRAKRSSFNKIIKHFFNLQIHPFLAVNSEIVFWTGSVYFACTTAVSLSVFFLMLDRCCILLRPQQNQFVKSQLSVLNAVLVFVQGFLFLAIMYKYERPDSYATGLFQNSL